MIAVYVVFYYGYSIPPRLSMKDFPVCRILILLFNSSKFVDERFLCIMYFNIAILFPQGCRWCCQDVYSSFRPIVMFHEKQSDLRQLVVNVNKSCQQCIITSAMGACLR